MLPRSTKAKTRQTCRPSEAMMPLERDDDIALQLAERMRKDYGPDARTGAVWAWFSRAIHEVRHTAYCQGVASLESELAEAKEDSRSGCDYTRCPREF